MAASMTYEELPEQIRSILPKNRFGRADLIRPDHIRTQTNYDLDWDHWKLVENRWVHVHKK